MTGGLCGVVTFNDAAPEALGIRRMVDTVSHRSSGRVTTVERRGFRGRVLSAGGGDGASAEVSTEFPNPVVLWHGRLDNRVELSRDLGLEINTPDADVVAASFVRHGESFASRLIGDYAFVLWDEDSQCLLAGRDCFSMRPLYYRASHHEIDFASEIKQLLARRSSSLSEKGVAAHLTGVFHLAGETVYEDIRELPPGTILRWMKGDFTLQDAARWMLPRRTRAADEGTLAEDLRNRFRRAVSDRLNRHQRIAVLLSGGIDSVAAASMAATVLLESGQSVSDRLHAICFDYSTYPTADERHISRMVTDHFGIPVTEIRADEYLPLSDYENGNADVDDPYMLAFQPLLLASLERARALGMDALLTGGRGDLLFGEFIYDFSPRARGMRDAWAELKEYARAYDMTLQAAIRHCLVLPAVGAMLSLHRAPRLRRWLRSVRRVTGSLPSAAPRVVNSDLARRTGLDQWLVDDTLPSARALPRTRRLAAIRGPMQMRVATNMERICARFGISYLDPWSDRRLADFALQVDQGVLNRVGDDKRLVRMAMEGVVPENARIAMRKIYPIDVYRSALGKVNRHVVTELCNDMVAAEMGFVDQSAVTELIERGDAESTESILWRLLSLEIWLRRMSAEGKPAPNIP